MTIPNDIAQTSPATPATGERPRVLSGMRPTGRLHLGNYMGALYNWVQLQHKYECYFFIADWHALTTDYADTSKLRDNVMQVALDFLAAGLDPSTIFVQSHVPQHAELHVLLSMFTPVSLLERVPTYKDQQEQLREKDLATYGFLGYPLLQSADILLYQPDFVPVGLDQAAHVELTREVARRFNQLYSPKRLVQETTSSLIEEPDPERLILPEPQVLLTPSPKLPGIDGRKMSKSYGNSILLSDHPAAIAEKMSRMSNGGQRNPQSVPGDPNKCPVGDMHVLFSPSELQTITREGCTSATISCVLCKEMAANSIVLTTNPIRLRREALEAKPDEVWSGLEAGARRASARAEITLDQVRSVMGLSRLPHTQTERLKKAYSARESIRTGHNLSARKAEWWDLIANARAKNLRDLWLAEIVPTEVTLKQDSENVYISANRKRVYVTTAREHLQSNWGFDVKPKSYEALALLCWANDGTLHDFVVPQSAYQAPWLAYKRAYKNEVMTFWVKQSGARFFLQLPGAEPVDISAYEGGYGAIV